MHHLFLGHCISYARIALCMMLSSTAGAVELAAGVPACRCTAPAVPHHCSWVEPVGYRFGCQQLQVFRHRVELIKQLLGSCFALCRGWEVINDACEWIGAVREQHVLAGCC